MKRTSLFAVILVVFGCDPGVEMETAEIDNLFSVNAFISPQDSIYKAYVYRGLALGMVANEDLATIKDAIVILTDGQDSDTLHLNSDKSYYNTPKKNLTVVPFKTYYLIVNVKGGPLIKASCIVPPAPELPQISGFRNDDDFDFDINWLNPSNHHYFVVSAIAEGKYIYNSPFGPQLTNLNARLDDRSLPSDKQKDFNSKSGTVWRAFLAESPKLTVLLSNVDGNMFHYYDTFDDYDNWLINSSDQSGVPSFIEPKPIFSNIEGGVGIFAAYNTKSVTIEIK